MSPSIAQHSAVVCTHQATTLKLKLAAQASLLNAQDLVSTVSMTSADLNL